MQTGLLGHIGERPIPVILVKSRSHRIRQEQVIDAIVIVVTDANSVGPNLCGGIPPSRSHQ